MDEGLPVRLRPIVHIYPELLLQGELDELFVRYLQRACMPILLLKIFLALLDQIILQRLQDVHCIVQDTAPTVADLREFIIAKRKHVVLAHCYLSHSQYNFFFRLENVPLFSFDLCPVPDRQCQLPRVRLVGLLGRSEEPMPGCAPNPDLSIAVYRCAVSCIAGDYFGYHSTRYT